MTEMSKGVTVINDSLTKLKMETSVASSGVTELRKDLTSLEKSSSDLNQKMNLHEKALADLKKELMDLVEIGLTEVKGGQKKQSQDT